MGIYYILTCIYVCVHDIMIRVFWAIDPFSASLLIDHPLGNRTTVMEIQPSEHLGDPSNKLFMPLKKKLIANLIHH
jgi:hypothetical protein